MKTIFQKTISRIVRASMILTVIPFSVLVNVQQESEEDPRWGSGGFRRQQNTFRSAERCPA